jgi:hypothetical protein
LAVQVQQELADLPDALRVEPIGGLVEDQQLRLAQQRHREAQPVPHAQRVVLCRPPPDLAEADLVEDLGDPPSSALPRPAGPGRVQQGQIGPGRQVPVGGRAFDEEPTRPSTCRPCRDARAEHLDLPEVASTSPNSIGRWSSCPNRWRREIRTHRQLGRQVDAVDRGDPAGA